MLGRYVLLYIGSVTESYDQVVHRCYIVLRLGIIHTVASIFIRFEQTVVIFSHWIVNQTIAEPFEYFRGYID